jgi:hypothetical protein
VDEPDLADRGQPHLPRHFRADVDRLRCIAHRNGEHTLGVALEVVHRRGVELAGSAPVVVQQSVLAILLELDACGDAGRQEAEQAQEAQDVDARRVAVLVADDPSRLRRRMAGLEGHPRRARLHRHLLGAMRIEDELVVIEIRWIGIAEFPELRLQVVVVDVADRRKGKLVRRPPFPPPSPR